MPSTSGDIEKRVRFTLLDSGFAGGQRFSDADLRLAITDGLRAIAAAKPIALATRIIFQLAPGAAQVLPVTHNVYLAPVRNMGAAGTTVGTAITSTDILSMDAADPNWYLATADDTVIQAMPDPFEAKRFHVYPPQPATAMGYVEVTAVPEIDPITLESDVLPLNTLFDNAVIFYTCFRLLVSDAEADANAALAKTFQENYFLALGK